MAGKISQFLIAKCTSIANKEMKTNAKRLDSFCDWPTSKTQKPKDLADSGFYFLGHDDKVACYYCGLILGEWMPGDNPWIEHALYSN